MRLLSSIFLLALVILVICFALLNAQTVTVNYFLAEREIPLSLLLLLALLLGCLLGFLVQLKVLLKHRYVQYQLNKKINLLNHEVSNLRALPIKEHL